MARAAQKDGPKPSEGKRSRRPFNALENYTLDQFVEYINDNGTIQDIAIINRMTKNYFKSRPRPSKIRNKRTKVKRVRRNSLEMIINKIMTYRYNRGKKQGKFKTLTPPLFKKLYKEMCSRITNFKDCDKSKKRIRVNIII